MAVVQIVDMQCCTLRAEQQQGEQQAPQEQSPSVYAAKKFHARQSNQLTRKFHAFLGGGKRRRALDKMYLAQLQQCSSLRGDAGLQ